MIQTKKGQQEVWQCKVYRSHGRAACSAPQIHSCDLDLSIAGALTVEEFKERNVAFNAQILACQGKLTAIRQEEENQSSEELDIPAIRRALD